MSVAAWSFVLQWSRVGASAIVFLFATRFLSLAEIGAFATAFALVRLAQGVHKAGVTETTIIVDRGATQLDALFQLSLVSGALISFCLWGLSAWVSNEVAEYLRALCVIPIVLGLSAVSEGLLRKSMKIRALAARTLAAQCLASILAVWALLAGWGATALVVYTLVSAIITSALSVLLAGWRPARLFAAPNYSGLFTKVSQITLRDAANSTLLPLAQIGMTAVFGLAAAGAFQIATRMLSLLDAVTLSPLRFIALPQFKSLVHSYRFDGAFHAMLERAVLLGAWGWFGVLAATQEILTLAVGADHAQVATPLLQAVVPLGLISALAMPFNQSLTAFGETKLVLQRAAFTLGLSLCFAVLASALGLIATVLALPLAAMAVMVWYLPRAFGVIGVPPSKLFVALPAMLAGVVMCLFLVVLDPLWSEWSVPLRLVAKIGLGTACFAISFIAIKSLSHRRALS